MSNISSLLTGFKRFQQRYYQAEPALYQELSQNQLPLALVISCCDSRLHPAQLFDVPPGVLFVLRTIANIVPNYHTVAGQADPTTAAVEFAVCDLAVSEIIVLGHSQCGGIKRLLTDSKALPPRDMLDNWLEHLSELHTQISCEYENADLSTKCIAGERANIALALKRLREFPCVQTKLATRDLSLHGWYFDFVKGELLTDRY